MPVTQCENVVSLLSAELNRAECYTQQGQALRPRERKENPGEDRGDVIFFQHCTVFSIAPTRRVSSQDGCSDEMLLKSVPAGAGLTRFPRRILSPRRRSFFRYDLRLY